MRRACGRLQDASMVAYYEHFGQPQGDAPTQFWSLMQHKRRAQEQVIIVIYKIHDPYSGGGFFLKNMALIFRIIALGAEVHKS